MKSDMCSDVRTTIYQCVNLICCNQSPPIYQHYSPPPPTCPLMVVTVTNIVASNSLCRLLCGKGLINAPPPQPQTQV